MMNITMKNAQKENGTKTKAVSSDFLHDGTLVEMLYNKAKRETRFLTVKDDNLNFIESFDLNGWTIQPYSPHSDFLENNVVLFPSEPQEYGSQKDLLEEMRLFIHKYLAVSETFEKIATYYVLFTWIYDDFNELPYIRAIGDYGTGKSRFLKVIGSLCYHAIFTSGATTPAPIFRMLNDFRGTLILDEADFRFSDAKTEIVKILNNGFATGTPVIRCEQNNKRTFDTRSFNVFSPKIIATRELYKDSALESRMITEDMNINSYRKDIPYNIPDEFEIEAQIIRNKLLMFRVKNKGKVKINPNLADPDIEPRLNQISIPLLSIIKDNEVLENLRGEIKNYNEKIKSDRTMSYEYQIVETIRGLYAQGNISPTMKDISDVFNESLEEKEKITSRKMGYLVKKCLNLKTERRREGIVIVESNREKIESLEKRYGLDVRDKDVNVVNNVNVEEEIKEISVDDVTRALG